MAVFVCGQVGGIADAQGPAHAVMPAAGAGNRRSRPRRSEAEAAVDRLRCQAACRRTRGGWNTAEHPGKINKLKMSEVLGFGLFMSFKSELLGIGTNFF